MKNFRTLDILQLLTCYWRGSLTSYHETISRFADEIVKPGNRSRILREVIDLESRRSEKKIKSTELVKSA